MDTNTLNEVAQLLRQLREADRDFRVFGSDSHRYKLGATWTEKQLLHFEQKNRISLPEDYRLFLKEIGNGGAGPYYGLHSLEEAAQYGDLSQPFPWTQETDFHADELTQIDARDEHPGALQLCHVGCAIYIHLVVNGPSRGTIWNADEDFHPTGMSFIAWYSQWLQRVLPVLLNASLANKLRLGMNREQIAAAISCNCHERQSLIEPKTILASNELPFQIELNEAGKLMKIKDLPFI